MFKKLFLLAAVMVPLTVFALALFAAPGLFLITYRVSRQDDTPPIVQAYQTASAQATLAPTLAPAPTSTVASTKKPVPTTLPATPTTVPTTPLVSDPTSPPIVSPIASSTHDLLPELDISLDSALATGIRKQSSKDSDIIAHEVLPEFTVYTLENYPLQSLVEPRMFVLRVNDEEALNNYTAKNIANLRQILQNKPDLGAYPIAGVNQPPYYVPWLVPIHATPIMHAQIEYLDFQNGIGLRYLTQYAQALSVVNNQELCYTFQGLTQDGKYHIIAVLPVNYPDLLAGPHDAPNGDPSVWDNAEKNLQYLQKTVQMLDEGQPSSFTPNLTKLDAMIRSIGIR